MKNSIITLSLLSTLLIGRLALAQDEVTPTIDSNKMTTIVVVAEPEVASFEIYSLKNAEKAINLVMEQMRDRLSASIAN